MVTDVQADSPAARAGVMAGDVVQSLDGETVGPEALNRMLAGRAVGSVAKLGLWRDGAASTVPVVIGAWPDEKPTANPAPKAACAPGVAGRHDLGLTLLPLTDDARGRLGLGEGAKGAQVADVAAGSVAADRGIKAGAVIVNVQRKPVATPAEVQAGIDAARASGRGFVLMLVRDDHGLRWVALPD
jgi:serine protease Do